MTDPFLRIVGILAVLAVVGIHSFFSWHLADLKYDNVKKSPY